MILDPDLTTCPEMLTQDASLNSELKFSLHLIVSLITGTPSSPVEFRALWTAPDEAVW